MSFFSRLFSSTPNPALAQPLLFVVGLGNPGAKYARTRHNLGWLALDSLQSAWGGNEWQLEKKFQAEISEFVRGGKKVFLIKPQTFMNDSGRSVRSVLDFYKAGPSDLIVIHDEADLPFGKVKTTLSSRAAGHNGVQDIIDTLGTQDFRRLRLGVGKNANPHVSTADHVLQPFTAEESLALPDLLKQATILLETDLLKG